MTLESDWKRGDFTISTDPRYLDLAMISRFLGEEAYWSRGRTAEQVRRSIDNSAMCFGIYTGALSEATPHQVGFARLVSDMTTFAWLCDVFVLPEARGQGLGAWLVSLAAETVRANGIRRVLLATRDAHALYARYGFEPLAEPQRWMSLQVQALAGP
ncbi:MAG TPA: GNAT family N-acetyltransferase [Chloroflexota bacterium]|nr:GNAT family N-acetyltransferase [Chloroflexota bacterium]